MDFSSRPECTDRLFAFMQRVHAVYLHRNGVLERRTDRAGLGRASRLSQHAISALSRIQLRRLYQLLPIIVSRFSYLHGHCRGAVRSIGRRCGAELTIVDHGMNRYQTRADSDVRIRVGIGAPARVVRRRLRPRWLRLFLARTTPSLGRQGPSLARRRLLAGDLD